MLAAADCAALAALWGEPGRFRSRVDMARLRFGVGEYRYFSHPLPPLVETLRVESYRRLAGLATRWTAALGGSQAYPPELAAFLDHCARQGQSKPTPLLLRYEAGGENCLHQDLYGAVAFPFQLTVFLSEAGVDHTGGEFLLVEQRPRAQSRGIVVPVERGGLVIFPTRDRPVRSARGHARSQLRHGVSRVRSGLRFTLGVIFHDAA